MVWKPGAPLLAAAALLLSGTPAQCVRVLIYYHGPTAFLQWDSRSPVGWSPPTGNSSWPMTDHGEAALGYIDGSLYVIGGGRHWSTPTGQTSRSGTPLYRQHEDRPTRLVKEVPLSSGTAKGGPRLAVARVFPEGGKGVTTGGNTRLAVCGSGQYAWDRGESSCEVLTSERLAGGGHRWMFLSLPRRMCGRESAATGGYVLGQNGIVVAGGRCRGDTTSDQVALIDLSTGGAHRLPPMKRRRAGHSITALGDRLVACGAHDEDSDSWRCEQLVLTAAGGGGLGGMAARASNATWQYIEHMPANADAALSEPAARVCHVAAVGADRLMAVTGGGDVLFWRPGGGVGGGGVWSGGPGLPFSGKTVGITVIHDEGAPVSACDCCA